MSIQMQSQVTQPNYPLDITETTATHLACICGGPVNDNAVNQQCDIRKVEYSAQRTTIHSNYRLTTSMPMLSPDIIKSGANGCEKVLMMNSACDERIMVIFEMDSNLDCRQY